MDSISLHIFKTQNDNYQIFMENLKVKKIYKYNEYKEIIFT